MLKIVAIGGGEIGRPGYPVETAEIDEQIARLTGKTKPKLLFIPTASSDSEVYCDAFAEHFGGRLGCRTAVLRLVGTGPGDEQQAADAILSCDAVYVGGGNTAMMMRIWRKRAVDRILREAASRGIVLSGLSAGAICWFRFGSSDSRRATNPAAELIRVRGLGLVPATMCPHYDVEEDRRPCLARMMQRTPGVAVALDNCCAIEVVGEGYRILTSRAGASARRMFWRRGELIEEPLAQDEQRQPLGRLLSMGSNVMFGSAETVASHDRPSAKTEGGRW